MFTRCPNCQKIQPLTVAQLRDSRAIVFCDDCSIHFDALEQLSDTANGTGEEIGAIEDTPLTTDLPWEKEPEPGRSYWAFGFFFAVLALIAQTVYFEGAAFIQNPGFRTGLEKLCRQLNCRLPVYKNLDEFTLLQSSFTPLPDQNYAFKVVINNQAPFAQAYPNIKLSLFDYNGREFAHRIFKPRDYLPEDAVASLMAVDATTEISLKIATPKTKVGGSTFDLIY